MATNNYNNQWRALIRVPVLIMFRSEKTISLEESLGNIIKEFKYHSTDDEIESVCKKSQ